MSHLLKPLEIKNLKLKNRLVMPPLATEKSKEYGRISKELLDYYDEKSEGGHISLIIVEHAFVSEEGRASKGQMSIADDSIIDDLKKLANIIHSNGSKAVMQINHAGIKANKENTGLDPVGPSLLEGENKELSIEGIKDIVEKFKVAALRAKKAGFDGVEIHAAHGYLLSQFFSPITNKRNDEYGGAVLSRIKIHLEVIKAVIDAVGKDYPVLIRFGASDYMDGGSTIEDGKVAAKEFQKAGVDILDISGGLCGAVVQGLDGQGYFAPLSEAIKDVVSIPVILTGGITDASVAEKLLKEEKADLIGVGRAILRDSTWAKKAIESLK
ncbi:NADH:flavin oxidoreductase [Clostridium cylindrosporum]|uniref:NADH oxidase n=1 Tax=Clostridium cylindrosporum DSM 605 TaxID=1121307 RepID=A0A0J8D9P9_CLOCY|nr:NADH:flavin oxidoreductase [Clostridium cylindrosporum]KMT21039.1 NADH oxidase [Clostridium cylindrosporum DSM 605]